MITYSTHAEVIINKHARHRKKKKRGTKETGTYMFSFPNSLFKLCESDRSANLAAKNAAVVVLPRKDAVL
jgi:hypothetical protein